MADVAWVTLRIWPWRDEWLEQDEELAEAFADVDLLDEGKLVGAMNGNLDVEKDEKGPGPAFETVTLSGEMRGGSYEIRDESSILEALRERGIAFHLSGDAKYEWDGDEAWWHPGRDEIFYSVAGEGGRFLDKHEFARLRERCLPVDERVEIITVLCGEAQANVEQLEAEDRNRVAAGEPTIGDYAIPVWKQAVTSHEAAIAKLLADRPEPEDLAALVTEFFELDPFAWRPDETWEPALKTESEVEA